MNNKTMKQSSLVALAACLTAFGLATAPVARAETPIDEIMQPAQSQGESTAPIAPAVSTTDVTQQPAISAAEEASGASAVPSAPVLLTAEVAKRRQPLSVIEVGVGKTSADSYKFGNYLGLEKSDPYLIGNVQLNRRGESNANYLEIDGRNLGLDSRNVKIKGGKQDDYSIRFEYDELTRLLSDSYQTPYSGMGGSVLTKPTVWTLDRVPTTPAIDAPGATTVITTAMMADLAANMKQFNVETRRKASKVALNKTLTDGWDVGASFSREKKDGTKLTGAVMQLWDRGDRSTVILPEPVNYTTDQFDVFTRYAGEKLHLQASYYVSLFSNANQSTTFDNLYYNAAFTGVAAGRTPGGGNATGRLGQMPDNQFHQINTSGGYTFTQATRLTGSLSIGRMKQNQAFLPFSTGGTMPATTSLNGKVDTTHADIKVNSRLTRELNFTAGYKYDDRDNRTAVNQYDYFVGDRDVATTQASRKNTPLSNNKRSLYADMDYRLTAATKLKLGLDLHKAKHTYEATTGDREVTVKAEVKHSFSDTTSAGLGYAHSNRKADSAYDQLATIQNTYSSTYLASLCTSTSDGGVTTNTFLYNGTVTNCTGAASPTGATYPFIETPALRSYLLADRKRDKLHMFASTAPTDRLDLQFDASYSKDEFPEAETGFGLTRAVNWAANFLANLAASETVSGTFFATLEDYSTDQNSHNGGAGTIGPASGVSVTTTNLDRQNNTALFDVRTGTINRSDRSLTLGVGFRVKPGGSYEWGSDLTHATTTGSTSFSNLGIGIAPGGIATATPPANPAVVLPVPDVVTRLNRFDLFGKYRLKKDMTLNTRYAYEKYSSSDWAWDGQTLTSSTSLVGTNQTSPKYEIHMINVSVSYMF